MRLDDSELRSAALSEQDVEFVSRMARGGQAGSQGSAYEDCFAVFQLLECARSRLIDGSTERATVTRQGRCAVDDVIYFREQHHFCQLKTSASATWGTERAKLERQFRLQQRLCQFFDLDYVLHVVTPHDARVTHFNEAVPRDLEVDFVAERFELFDRRPDFWTRPGRVLEALRELHACGSSSPSELESLAVAFFNAWFDCQRDDDGHLNVDVAIEYCRRGGRVPLVDLDAVVSEEDAQVIVNLRELGVDLTVERGFCQWASGNESGVVGSYRAEHTRRFFERLAADPVENFDEFWERLP